MDGLKLLDETLYYITYRLRNTNLHRTKDEESKWRVMVLEEFLHTVTVSSYDYQNYKILAVLEQCSLLVEKQLFYITGYCECLIGFSPKLISNN